MIAEINKTHTDISKLTPFDLKMLQNLHITGCSVTHTEASAASYQKLVQLGLVQKRNPLYPFQSRLTDEGYNALHQYLIEKNM